MSDKKEDNLFDEHYYKICKKLMWLIGLWPYQALSSKIPYYILVFFMTVSLIIVQIWECFHSGMDINNMADVFPVLFASFIVLTKIYGFTFNHRKVKVLLDKVQENWKNFNSKKETEVLKKYASFGNYLASLYSIYMCAACILYLIPPFVILVSEKFVPANSSWPKATLPANVYYGRDTDEIFTFALIHTSTACLLFALTFSALDSFFIILVQHVCSIFDILCMLIEQIAVETKLNYGLHPQKNNDPDYLTVMRCIVIHKDILLFSNDMESIFTVTLFFEIGLHIAMISVTGVQVLMHSTIFSDAVRYILLAIAQMLHLLWICWQAQAILNSSALVNKSICKGNWYKMSERSKQLLKLMLMRSSKSCELTAGKIFRVSLEGFSVVLKTTISYFTVLKSFQ